MEFVRLFRQGLKISKGGEGIPKEGSEPLTPYCATLIHYTVTPPNIMSLGFNFDTQKPDPGFLGVTANVAALCMLTDGLRTGEVTSRVVFPKLKKDLDSIPLVKNIVFVCRKFGANSIYAFLERFPNTDISLLFIEMITDDAAYVLFLSALTKPGRRRFLWCAHFHCIGSPAPPEDNLHFSYSEKSESTQSCSCCNVS